MAVCTKLSRLGYTIALDDFVFNIEMLPLIELANIIKIDYRLSTADEIERILYRLSRYDIKYLAEKIETYEEFEHARKLGFHYFQGYFFARPESIKMREVSSVKISKIRLMAEITRRDTSIENLQKIIETDVAIAYKLLRYINSAYYYLLKEVTSIRQAIIYLGEKEIRRFIILVIISELAAEKPTELLRLSLIRARFCELLAEGSQFAANAAELFILGLFSLIDAILDTTMQQALEKLPLTDVVKQALTSQQGPLAPIMQAVIAYEQGKPEECFQTLQTLKLDTANVYDIYIKSLEFSSIID
jgi:EAL and modified HD-GYP domain-containing signal transduction protein